MQKLTGKQLNALVALLEHGAVEPAAQAAGVSKATLWRWLQDATFAARYREMRRQLVETALSELQANAGVAVRVLREVAEDQAAPASARVTAARTILEQSISAVELTDLQARIEQLEKLTAETEGKQKRWA